MKRSRLVIAAVSVALGAGVAAQHRSEPLDTRLVGYSDLQGRRAYQPIIHRQGERWIAYVGHHGGLTTAAPSTPSIAPTRACTSSS